jgi:hypothetical protein
MFSFIFPNTFSGGSRHLEKGWWGAYKLSVKFWPKCSCCFRSQIRRFTPYIYDEKVEGLVEEVTFGFFLNPPLTSIDYIHEENPDLCSIIKKIIYFIALTRNQQV